METAITNPKQQERADKTSRRWLRALPALPSLPALEDRRVLLMAANLFLMMAAYYLLKTARETLILSEGGAEVKSYAAGFQALLLIVVIPAIRRFSASPGLQLATRTTAFFAAHLLIFIALGLAGAGIGTTFFIWFGMFNVVVIALGWSVAADLCSHRSAQSVFPALGLGSSLGGWAGAEGAAQAFALLGPWGLMMLAALLMAASILVLQAATQAPSIAPSQMADSNELVQKPNSRANGNVRNSRRYLWLIAALILLVNLVNSTGEYMLGRLVATEAARIFGASAAGETLRQAYVGQFYSSFYSSVGLLGVVLQVLLALGLFRRMGVAATLLVLPLSALAGYGAAAFAPSLAVLAVAKLVENGADYSVQNTALQSLYAPTSRETKYGAKLTIESLAPRAGDLLHAAVVLAGSHWALDFSSFAFLNLLFIVLWLAVVAALWFELQPARATRPVASIHLVQLKSSWAVLSNSWRSAGDRLNSALDFPVLPIQFTKPMEATMRSFVLATLTLFMMATFVSAQEATPAAVRGYGFFGGGGIFSGGEKTGIFHLGGGAEGLVYKGLGVGAEVGYLAPKQDWGEGFGLFSPNLSYHFQTTSNQKTVPFVTGGYSLAFRDGTANLFNFGGGVDYWATDRLGLRFDVRDHVSPNGFGDSAAHFLVFRVGILGR